MIYSDDDEIYVFGASKNSTTPFLFNTRAQSTAMSDSASVTQKLKKFSYYKRADIFCIFLYFLQTQKNKQDVKTQERENVGDV
jgi:hypothetical protein